MHAAREKTALTHDSNDKAYFLSRAEKYCATQEQCSASVRTKLYEWGCEHSIVDDIIEKLQAERYVDDSRYAIAFCQSKIRHGHWGKIKIKHALQEKGVPNNTIDHAISLIDIDEYCSMATDVARKHWLSMSNQDSPKLIRFMQSRGFEPQLTYQIIDELTNNK